MAITVLQGVGNNASTLHPDRARLLEPKTRPGMRIIKNNTEMSCRQSQEE
jgi:hypothetical protein